jgi:hypothetical protein
MPKIDDKGIYQPFEGVTVVASIREKDSDFWRSIHEFLVSHPLISAYYSPLPLESYHVTTLHLFTEDHKGAEDWKVFILRNLIFFQRLQEELKRHKVELEISMDKIVIDSTIYIEVSLPIAEVKIIQEIAKKMGIEDNVSSPFHVTLAYGYKSIDSRSYETLCTDLAKFLTSIKSAKAWVCKPTLCYFNSMVSFIPWLDVTANPFAEGSGKKPGFFTRPDEGKGDSDAPPSRCIMQ